MRRELRRARAVARGRPARTLLRRGGAGARTLALVAVFFAAWPAAAAGAPGDAIVTVASRQGGALLRVTPGGAVTPVHQGAPLAAPVGVVALPGGEALVADPAAADRLLRVPAAPGPVAAAASGGVLDEPMALALDAAGAILVADDRDRVGPAGAVLRIPAGAMVPQVVAVGAPLVEPNGIVVEPGGTLLVSDRLGAGTGAVWRVAPATGTVTPVATGRAIAGIQGLAVLSGGATVAVLARGPRPALVRLDPNTGAAAPILAGGPLRDPAGVAALPDGRALVADPGSGALIAVDPATGSAATLAAHAALRRATAVAIVLPHPAAPPVGPEAEPTPAASPPPASPAPAPAPAAPPAAIALGPVSLEPTRFQAARSGRGLFAEVGTRVTFTLSAATQVRYTVHVACRSRGARPRGRACRGFRRLLGKWILPGAAGANERRFTGRLRGRRLPVGRYRLYVKAQQPDGRWGRARIAPFRIVK
jgi:hypothetical protein